MNSAPTPSQTPGNSQESNEENLQSVGERLRSKGIDPEKAMEGLSKFREEQREFGNAIERYNQAAAELAASTGSVMEESQKAKFPSVNIRIENPDVRKYYRLSKSAGSPEESGSQELPVELL